MVSSTLKSLFHAKKIRQTVKNRSAFHGKNSGKIGLIIADQNLETSRPLLELHKLLEINDQDLKIIICHDQDPEIPGRNVEILKPEGVSVSGKFKSEKIRDFAKENFDFLICYFTERNLSGVLLAAETAAGKKFGNKPDEFDVFDVEIGAGNIEEFQQEVKKYFEIFKK